VTTSDWIGMVAIAVAVLTWAVPRETARRFIKGRWRWGVSLLMVLALLWVVFPLGLRWLIRPVSVPLAALVLLAALTLTLAIRYRGRR
jgi:hypothetical protein